MKYKNTNVKFNVEDPIQMEAWNYLHSQKGTDSYAKIIARAISEANKPTYEPVQPTYNVSAEISDSDVNRIADRVVDKLLDMGLAVNSSVASEIAKKQSFEDKPQQNVSEKEPEFNEAYITQDCLDFASG